MPEVAVSVSCPIHDSFRVRQVAGLFDVPLAGQAEASFRADVPSPDEAWDIGLVVGPSGSGKSTIARRAFGDCVYSAQSWPHDKAVVDGFPPMPAKTLTGLLTAVGFSSPPSWIKPYAALSRGEQFRCDLARALAGGAAGEARARPLVVFDEFTSVVDRNVAHIGSAAVAKAIRAHLVACRFVAVTCHYDIAEWLEPDWVVDMADGTCQRRRLRRGAIELELFRCRRDEWEMFRRHHYLSGQLAPAARCYTAAWRGTRVAFCAMLPLVGYKDRWRISRIVTLPDFQGVGIGMRVAERVAALYVANGCRVNVTASHPALLAHCRRSPLWHAIGVVRAGARRMAKSYAGYRGSTGRAVASFEYVGPLAVANHEES